MPEVLCVAVRSLDKQVVQYVSILDDGTLASLETLADLMIRIKFQNSRGNPKFGIHMTHRVSDTSQSRYRSNNILMIGHTIARIAGSAPHPITLASQRSRWLRVDSLRRRRWQSMPA